MKHSVSIRKILALLLAAVMLLSSAAAFADMTKEEYAEEANQVPSKYEGKTVILHSNDVHGAIDGYAYMPALRRIFQALGADVILADVGDFSQGTAYVSYNKGESAIEMMNAAGYDIATLGNHEFDFGYDQLMENLSKAQFKVICANVYLDETGETILDPSAVIETPSGLKIGFFGMETPETATKVNPGLIRNIHFSTFDDLYAAAKEQVDKLREDSDLVICLAHLGVDEESKPNGYRSIDLADKVEGIDFIIDGHSHTIMSKGEHGEKIQSTGTKFSDIGVIVIDNETKTIEDNFLIATEGLPKDPAVEAKAKEIMDEVDALYGAVFAKTEVLLNGDKAPGNRTQETNLGDLIADALVWKVLKEGGTEQNEPHGVIGITNGGGIRATIQPGDITMNDIHTVLPFGNTISVVYLTGNEVLEALEASTFAAPEAIGGYPQTSGMQWTLDTTKAFDQGELYTLNGKDTTYYAPASIQRVTIESVNGEPFDPEAVYAVVTNDFCSAGGDTYNVFARNEYTFNTGIPMDEAVIAYITEVLNGTITEEAYGAPQGRETQIPAVEEALPAAA